MCSRFPCFTKNILFNNDSSEMLIYTSSMKRFFTNQFNTFFPNVVKVIKWNQRWIKRRQKNYKLKFKIVDINRWITSNDYYHRLLLPSHYSWCNSWTMFHSQQQQQQQQQQHELEAFACSLTSMFKIFYYHWMIGSRPSLDAAHC